jgi:superfamily II DNA or RNA helicase
MQASGLTMLVWSSASFRTAVDDGGAAAAVDDGENVPLSEDEGDEAGDEADARAADARAADAAQEAAWLATLVRVRDLLAQQAQVSPLPDGQVHVAMACARTNADAITIAGLARRNELPAAAYTGEQTVAQRRRFMDSFRDGEIRLLVICNMLLEGFDHPQVSVVAVMSHVTSVIKFSQFLGRAVRLVRPGPPQQLAYCVHHRFFRQDALFVQYDEDRLILDHINRAERQFHVAVHLDDEEEEAVDAEDEEEAVIFEAVINARAE